MRAHPQNAPNTYVILGNFMDTTLMDKADPKVWVAIALPMDASHQAVSLIYGYS